MNVRRNNWRLKAGKAFQKNEKYLGPFLIWDFKFQSVGGEKKKDTTNTLLGKGMERNIVEPAHDRHRLPYKTKRFHENNPAKTLHYT